MAKARYSIIYDPEVIDHLRAIDRKHHPLIRRTIEEQLTFNPDEETRNRKRLVREAQIDADWELRFGPDNRFRVFYAMDMEQKQVQILAIGTKIRDRLYIAGEELI